MTEWKCNHDFFIPAHTAGYILVTQRIIFCHSFWILVMKINNFRTLSSAIYMVQHKNNSVGHILWNVFQMRICYIENVWNIYLLKKITPEGFHDCSVGDERNADFQKTKQQ